MAAEAGAEVECCLSLVKSFNRPERLTLLEKASRLSFSGCRGIFFFSFSNALESDASDPFNPTFRERGVRWLSQRAAALAVLCGCCPRMETEMIQPPRVHVALQYTHTCLNVRTCWFFFSHSVILARRCLPELPGEDVIPGDYAQMLTAANSRECPPRVCAG